jgi:hypothetical protein
MTRAWPLAAILCCAVVAACGFDVQAPDDFLMTRTGGGKQVTLLVNDAGTIRCDRGKARSITSAMLISARDLVLNLDTDAKANLRIRQSPNSVYRYTVSMQDGTIAFPDTAAVKHPELSGVEQYALQALAGPCRGVAQ